MAAIRAINSSITRPLWPSRPPPARMDTAVGVAVATTPARRLPDACRMPRPTPAGAMEIFSEEVFRGLVETTLSRVIFRNMTSEDRTDEAQAHKGRAGPRPRDDRLHLDLTDPKA